MTSTEELLTNRFGGPLLKLEEVAEILGRRPNSLRILINSGKGSEDLARKLRDCKVHLGRRVLFRLNGLAKMIDEA